MSWLRDNNTHLSGESMSDEILKLIKEEYRKNAKMWERARLDGDKGMDTYLSGKQQALGDVMRKIEDLIKAEG